MKHPPFDSLTLKKSWDWAIGPDLEFRIISLLDLATNRDRLPGAVFFTVPDDSSDKRWRDLVDMSQPYCGCASRRVLWPTQGRSRFIPRDPSKLVTVELDRDQPSHLVDGTGMLIRLHGGDLQSAYALWGFRSGEFLGTQLPYMQDDQGDRQLIWNQGGVASSDIRPNTWRASLSDLEMYLAQYGELTFMQLAPGITGRKTYDAWLPTCSIVKVDYLDRPGSTSGWRATFEIDATVQVCSVKAYDTIERHVCVGDVVA